MMKSAEYPICGHDHPEKEPNDCYDGGSLAFAEPENNAACTTTGKHNPNAEEKPAQNICQRHKILAQERYVPFTLGYDKPP